MIAITKTMFETPQTIPKMVEQIVLQGMLEESKRIFTTVEDVKLTDDQIKWIAEFVYPSSRVVHLKGERQSGRTSFGVGMVLATALFQENSCSMIMSQNEQMSRVHQIKTLDYLRRFCEVFSLPELLTPRRSSQKEIIFVNGSRILFERKTDFYECAFRGRRLDSVFIDFFNKPTMESFDEEFMSFVIPSIAYNEKPGKLIVSLGA